MRPGVYPASMEVAPYSPSARAKASTVPARTPCLQQGIWTRQKTQELDRPRVRPASARFWSKLSKAPRAVRYIRGKATTTVAKMADCQVITSRTPNASWTQAPRGRLGPSSISSSQPTTVGGRTRGRVRITSSAPFTPRGRRAIHWAAAIPKKNTAAVETAAMRRELNRGYQSITVLLSRAFYHRMGENPTASNIFLTASSRVELPRSKSRKALASSGCLLPARTAAG